MARNLGIPGGQVPPAQRSTTPGWRDPRLWVGIAVVAASVLVGTRVLASADDTVQVWAVAADVAPGERIDEGDLVARRLRFGDSADLERYLEVDDELPAELTVTRELGAGELLPRAALGSVDDEGTVTISLAVSPLLVPSGVGPGSVVDVYVSGEPADPDADARRSGEPVLAGVRVVAAPSGESFDTGADRQVELAVPDAEVAGFYSVLGGLTAPVVSLAQVG